jgi:hypothetical protein
MSECVDNIFEFQINSEVVEFRFILADLFVQVEEFDKAEEKLNECRILISKLDSNQQKFQQRLNTNKVKIDKLKQIREETISKNRNSKIFRTVFAGIILGGIVAGAYFFIKAKKNN